MAWRDDRLRDILVLKGLAEPADIHRKTKISYPQIMRYTTLRGKEGFGVPNVETLATLAIQLELDADFLLDSDSRYKEMTTLQAAAHMSLDRYVTDEAASDTPISNEDLLSMRLTATNHTRPPLWISEWRREHESIRLRRLAEATPAKALQKPTG